VVDHVPSFKVPTVSITRSYVVIRTLAIIGDSY
jgi:hypothetical protein